MLRPILITGTHRSGTTWVGNVLAMMGKVHYINEPFNINSNKRLPITNWFENVEYFKNDRLKEFDREFEILIGSSLWSFKYDYEIGYRYMLRNVYNRLFYSTLVKDPIALFSSPYLYKRFQFKIIVLIRHPAAFISSLKTKNWMFDFNNIYRQRFFVKSDLKYFKDDIELFSTENRSIIDQGILFWNIANFMIEKYKRNYKNKDWYFIRHEDLSSDPIHSYRHLYKILNFEFTSKIEDKIVKSTNGSLISELNRDSKQNIKSWKRLLKDSEIQKIWDGTREISSLIYSESEW